MEFSDAQDSKYQKQDIYILQPFCNHSELRSSKKAAEILEFLYVVSFVYRMTEAQLMFLIQRLNSLLLKEDGIISGLKDQILKLETILHEIQCFIGDADRKKEEEAIRNWLRELNDTIQDMDDCVDEFVVQMHRQNGSGLHSLIVHFGSELEKMEAQFAAILDRKARIDVETTAKGVEEKEKTCSSADKGESSSFKSNFINLPYCLKSCLMCCCIFPENDEKTCSSAAKGESSSFESNFVNLPYYLKSCLMYCCIFPENDWIPKGRLIRLLVAEDLIVKETQGEIVEDIAEDYIAKLISKGMLRVDEEHSSKGTKFKVTHEYRNLCIHVMEAENFSTACRSSDAQIPVTTRRIAIHDDGKNMPPDLNSLPIRSLFMFGISRLSESSWDCLKTALCSIKLLRVLHLEGVKIENLPNEVGDLIHLRYLSLKKSDINELPESLSNLWNLQTLDIRWCGKLETLPSGLLNLRQLRHLKMFKNMGVHGVRVPKGIGRLGDLQTLTGLYSGSGIAEELSSLTQLKTLGVMDVSEDHTSELYTSIMNMGSLVSLSIEAYPLPAHLLLSGTSPSFISLHLDAFVPPSLLKKLRLEGILATMPGWFISMKNLTKLRLGFSHLSENPAVVLQLLPNLIQLCLWHAHDAIQIGREFCTAGGFPRLEDLTIASHVLEEWTELEEGAMPRLKYLRLHNCLRLRTLPEGLQHLTTLKKLYLLPLLDDHEHRLRPDGGEENYKIKHIPRITYMTTSMVERYASRRL